MPDSPEVFYCLHETVPRSAESNLLFWSQIAGLTCNLDDAEVFTWEEALARHRGQPSSFPLPFPYLEALCRRVADPVLLRHGERLRLLPARAYACRLGEMPMFETLLGAPRFLALDGGLTDDLRAAKVFHSANAQVLEDVVFWPADYVDERSYLAVDRAQVDLRTALGDERFAQLSPVHLSPPVPLQPA